MTRARILRTANAGGAPWSGGYSTSELYQPWVVYHFGLTHDGWWPLWNSTHILGRARIVMECAVCGMRETTNLRIPRFRPVPEPKGGRHPVRIRFLLDHLHRDRPHPMSWARPLLNPAAHAGGIDLDQLAMRLEAELNEGGA